MSGRARGAPSFDAVPATEHLAGDEVALAPLAEEAARRYAAEYPDESARYGPHWRAWCRHDLQHILAWAVMDADGHPALADNVAWLARVLAARGYPVGRLVRALAIAADVAAEWIAPGGGAVADRLRRLAESPGEDWGLPR